MTHSQLLSLCRRALSQSMALHLHSVNIGRLEPIADSGVLDEDAKEARIILEQMDRACAEIDRACEFTERRTLTYGDVLL